MSRCLSSVKTLSYISFGGRNIYSPSSPSSSPSSSSPSSSSSPPSSSSNSSSPSPSRSSSSSPMSSSSSASSSSPFSSPFSVFCFLTQHHHPRQFFSLPSILQ